MLVLETTRPPHARAVLESALETYRDRIVLACSFGGPTGMVLLDLVAKIDPTVPVCYIDTGLLFPQTYALIERVRQRYGIEPIAVAPELDLRAQAERYGEALWAADPDRCCAMRKVEPQRAFLAGYSAWITGLRRDQSAGRRDVRHVEQDANQPGLVKISPLADWSEADCWTYIRANDVPYNPLHDDDYPSIGCAPCTRRVRKGEDSRAGRWADYTKTECGLHATGGAA